MNNERYTRLDGIDFITSCVPFDRSVSSPAVMFRRKFTVDRIPDKAILSVCGLGYAYYYINGRNVTEDLFTAPVSDYTKTLWVNEYDVASLLSEGENVIAVICGNGWYNECVVTSWDFDNAPWRDKPKFILSLEADGKRILTTDSAWKANDNTPVRFNEMRIGETFDSRMYDANWKCADFDDSAWGQAAVDTRAPRGIFRLCPCSGIREECVIPSVSLTKMEEKRYIFDIGRNISGYVRLNVTGHDGDELEIRYAEKLTDDGELDMHNMQNHYKNREFSVDRFICCGKNFVWSPKFAYHGFRYIELRGLDEADLSTVSGVFVHQDLRKTTGFECSDSFLNRLFEAGQNATLSNIFYMPTDCPTREKLGWCNDAQSSCDQMMTDFNADKLFEKWLIDIYDAMLPGGMLPGIIPSSGWGYGWGNGPVSEGILFEVPYRIYLHTGRADAMINSRPYFARSLAYFETRRDENGDITYGLDDWTAPYYERMVRAPFVNELLIFKFLKIAALAAHLDGDIDGEAEYIRRMDEEKKRIREKYIKSDGECVPNAQTAAAMLIYYDIAENDAPLKAQLKRLVEEADFHHDCGMVGMRYIFPALNKCGLYDYAFRILTASGYPSFRDWDEDGMTTLYETWHMKDSLNHHMFSCFMTWMTKTIVGIVPTVPGCTAFEIAPCFFSELEFASGWRDTPCGRLSVKWERVDGRITLKVNVPAGLKVKYCGEVLAVGENTIAAE